MSVSGYLYGITSERRLADECRLNLAFMWFLGYDLNEMPPDHSFLSKSSPRRGSTGMWSTLALMSKPYESYRAIASSVVTDGPFYATYAKAAQSPIKA